MLLRDHFSPKDPKASSLLCAIMDRYFIRMSVKIDPDKPNFEETQWIISEDVNVEHLLDVFTAIDPNSDRIWEACANFVQHLFWHKNRLVILTPKIEGLPEDHRFKPECLSWLSRLSYALGNHAECKRLGSHALKLQRERGDLQTVAESLRVLANANRWMDLPEEGIQQAKEALEICERLGDRVEQAQSLVILSVLLYSDNQLSAAEEAASRATALLQETGQRYWVCESHQVLGWIYRSKGKTKKAIHHFEVAIGIASSFNWHESLFWFNYDLARLFLEDGRFDDAQAHIERSKSHATNNAYFLGCATELQAVAWRCQDRLEDARTEALRAADIYNKLGAAKRAEGCRELLQEIEKELDSSVASASNCELL